MMETGFLYKKYPNISKILIKILIFKRAENMPG